MVGLPLCAGKTAVVAEITDESQFISATTEARTRAIDSLKSAGVKAVVGKGEAFRKLTAEGWEAVPGTRDFCIRFM
jgi:hypothetical protein